MNDRWRKMVTRQADFQNGVWGDNKVEQTKELILGLLSEANELLQEISWKAKRREHAKIKRSNVLEEIVDMLKYVLGIAVAWGFTSDEIFAAFNDKSDVVEQRWRQEFPLFEIIEQGAPIVVLDIDGVLSNWPYCFYDFVDEAHPRELHVKDRWNETQNPFEALANDPLTIRRWKDEYRQSGTKRTLVPVVGAVEFTQAIRARGYKIVLVTARPYHEYSRIFADTMYWLDNNGFAYDAIMWSERKEERLAEEFDLEQIKMFVDDNPINVDMVSACGVQAMLLKRPYNPSGSTFEEILEALDE